MSSSTPTTSVTHTGSGTGTSFTVPFAFVSHAHVVVELRTLPGGPVTTLTGGHRLHPLRRAHPTARHSHPHRGILRGLATGAQLTVRRVVPLTQGVQLPVFGPFASRTIEDALDVAAMRSQAEAEARAAMEDRVEALEAGGGGGGAGSQWVDGAAGAISYSAGNVGVGTATPTSKLHVVGSANVSGDLSAGGVYAAAITTDGLLRRAASRRMGTFWGRGCPRPVADDGGGHHRREPRGGRQHLGG